MDLISSLLHSEVPTGRCFSISPITTTQRGRLPAAIRGQRRCYPNPILRETDFWGLDLHKETLLLKPQDGHITLGVLKNFSPIL